MRAKKRKPYSSDLSDKEWDRIQALIKADKHFGAKSRTKYSRREMLNALFYVLHTGCQWRELPNDFPPWSAVYMQFSRWKERGLFIKIHDHLRVALRKALGRNGEASVGIADSQSIKTAEKKGSVGLMEIKELKVEKDTYWLITLG
jgi:putative transposase